MYDVILWAAIATIVCVVFYSVLGKSVGKGPESSVDPTKLFEKESNTPLPVIDPVADDLGFPALRDIAAADPGFTPAYFIDGAKGAYSMILESFASGDKDDLKDLLTPSVYEVYAAAIDERLSENLTQVTDLARLIDAEIVDATKTGSTAHISVEYTAELSSALVDADGQTVQGDPDLLSRVSEVWTFERDLKSKDLNWRLSDVSASEGDELEADPTPDTKD